LHDLASRGWKDVHLVEKDVLGHGTSSRSTKLIHGGLRYLRRVRDFGLVSEALHERRLLINLAPDIVRPIELIYPIMRKGGMPGFMVKMGLKLYDTLAGRYRLERHRRLSPAEVKEKAPNLSMEPFSKFYSFWDGQTDDLALVQRVAASAVKLGASFTEHCRAENIDQDEDGWRVTVRTNDGVIHVISARYVVNAVGPWANELMERSAIVPTHRAINDKGSHLLMGDMGLKCGLFFESPDDGRIFFLLPWLGYTLLGTTESIYQGNLDRLQVDQEETRYLLERVNRYLTTPLREDHVIDRFAGLRWLAMERGQGISSTTRSHVIGERAGSKRGLMLTIYGGKLTTYRTLSREIGDRIIQHFGEQRESRTHEAEFWVGPGDVRNAPGPLGRWKIET